MMHLLMIEELLDQQDFRRSALRGVVLPQVMAFAYYQLSWLLYVVRPSWSYGLNADVGELFRRIALDEAEHRSDSERRIHASRFGDGAD